MSLFEVFENVEIPVDGRVEQVSVGGIEAISCHLCQLRLATVCIHQSLSSTHPGSISDDFRWNYAWSYCVHLLQRVLCIVCMQFSARCVFELVPNCEDFHNTLFVMTLQVCRFHEFSPSLHRVAMVSLATFGRQFCVVPGHSVWQ